MNSNRTRFFIFILAIAAVAILIFNLNRKQTESDCSKAETFDKTSSKCVVKTATEYINDLEKIDKVERELKTEKERRDGTTCIPASEAYNYIGVTGCVRLGVYTTNHTAYGYAWLDSESSDSPTEFVVFAKNNVLTVSDTNYYFGRIIEVSGTITSYNGKAQIEIGSKSAINDIGTIADNQARVIETTNNAIKDAVCENYLEYKQKCEKGITMMCSMAQTYENRCRGYVSTKSESLESRRKNCYESKIKNASTKSQKDEVYDICKNPT